MSHRRPARAALSLFLAVWAAAAAAPPSLAAEAPAYTMTLVAQSPFTTVKDPVLTLSVRITNAGGEPATELSIGLTIGDPIRSRDAYERFLGGADVGGALASIDLPQKGRLAPGQTRTFTIEQDLSATGVSSTDSLVYPAQVQVRAGGVAIAVLNTPLVTVVRRPEVPLRTAWWMELAAPPAFDPTGVLVDRSFEAAIAPEGWIGSEIEALRRIVTDPARHVQVDVAIEPAVIDQLERMAQGYPRADGTKVAADTDGARHAADLLRVLRELATSPEIQWSAMGFSAPVIPSLLSSGLPDDLDRQAAAGAAALGTVGITPTGLVARPPGGELNDASINALLSRGASTILADADTVARPTQDKGFAPLPTAEIPAGAIGTADLVLPDPGTQALVEDPAVMADPVLAAQSVFGELATIWRESPVPASPTVRGVALALPAGLTPGLWGPLTRRIADAPFLKTVRAQDLVREVSPRGPLEQLRDPSAAAFTHTYTQGIRTERRDVEAYRSMLVTPSPVPDRLDLDLLYAESGAYLGSGEFTGRAWIDHVTTTTGAVFERVGPPPAGPTGSTQVFTFTSKRGTVPVQMGDPGATPLRVVVQLRSAWFRFPDGSIKTVVLSHPNQVVSFQVEATAGSQGHTIQLLVRAPQPSGRPIDQHALVVRTAAVNRFALFITAAAALGLVILWTRRLVRSRRSPRAEAGPDAG
jgi:hypothetical protein